MSDVLYSKLRLEVPEILDGTDATITSENGATRTVEMNSPITDIMLPGMEKYRVQAGLSDTNVGFGYGQIKKEYATYRSFLKRLSFYLSILSQSGCVSLNGEIHILSQGVNHYKWNGTSWVSVSTIPYFHSNRNTVVLNNEIHILGDNYNSSTNNGNKHYKWNGTSWVSVSTLPYNYRYPDQSQAVVLNGEIHLLGGDSNGAGQTAHYKWNGTSWVRVSTLPYNFNSSKVTILNNEIHLLGGGILGTDSKKHYKWNGTSWVSVSTLPLDIGSLNRVVTYKNEIYTIGHVYKSGSSCIEMNSMQRFNGNEWINIPTPPFKVWGGACVWQYNNNSIPEIIIFGDRPSVSNNYIRVAQWNPVNGWLEAPE